MESIIVAGMGNYLMKDDGVGIHVIESLKDLRLPIYVKLVDCGTDIISLIYYVEKIKKLIIIDAAYGNNLPGSIYKLTPKDLDLTVANLSLHEIGLKEMLSLLKLIGKYPEDVIIIGIEPKQIAYEVNLSSEVANAISEVIKLVLKEIS